MSTQIVSANDGGRTVGLNNFGDKKAAPFTKGKKRRKAVLAKAVAAKARSKDMSNAGGEDDEFAVLTAAKRKALSPGDFVFPAKKAYPIQDLAHARDALARSSGKPEEGVVRAAVLRKFPELKKKAA